jgi:citrate synthase
MNSEHPDIFPIIYYSLWSNGLLHPIRWIQSSLALLAMGDPELSLETREANVHKAIRIVSGIPALIACWDRVRKGLKSLPPDMELSHSANFLWQLTGERADSDMARALDVSLILQAEHTLNASTFACREVASTGAHMYAATAAGIGALSGSLHGGANVRVLEMLYDLHSANMPDEKIAEWVRGRLDRKEKIMGMGHAVYKTYDPRATILKEIGRRLSKETTHEQLYQLLSKIDEETVKEFEKRGKPKIKANVDFYTGLLYAMMGIPTDLMTSVFAMALSCGWCAHVIEEKFGVGNHEPSLYSPESEYIGRYCGETGCAYIPIEARQ